MRKLCLIVLFLLFITSAVPIEYGVTASFRVNPVYELSLNIKILSNVLATNSNLSVLIELRKNTEDEVNIDLEYEVLKNKKIIKSGYIKTINLVDEHKEIIPIYIDMPPGRYKLKITAESQQMEASDADVFWVRKKMRFKKLFEKFLGFLRRFL